MSVLLERPGLELEAVNVRGQTAMEVAQARGHHQVNLMMMMMGFDGHDDDDDDDDDVMMTQ